MVLQPHIPSSSSSQVNSRVLIHAASACVRNSQPALAPLMYSAMRQQTALRSQTASEGAPRLIIARPVSAFHPIHPDSLLQQPRSALVK